MREVLAVARAHGRLALAVAGEVARVRAVDGEGGDDLAQGGREAAQREVARRAPPLLDDVDPAELADLLDLDRPMSEMVKLAAERKGTDVRDVMVVVLDRPRHQDTIDEIREAGARVRLIADGDVAAAMLAVSENSPVDLLWGVGGTPEGVISACALKCMGGQLVGRLWPRDDAERQAALDGGYDLDKQLTVDDLVSEISRAQRGHVA